MVQFVRIINGNLVFTDISEIETAICVSSTQKNSKGSITREALFTRKVNPAFPGTLESVEENTSVITY